VRAALGSGSQGSAALPPARTTSSQPASPPPTDHSPPASHAQEPAPALCAGAPPAGKVRAHDFVWFYAAVTLPIGGSLPRRSWSVRLLSGETIFEDGDAIGPGRTRRPLDYILDMFPQQQLGRMVRLTSAKLEARRFNTTTAGEVLKFIGVLVLGTRHEFGSRADLWSTVSRIKHIQAPSFGKLTGVSRDRFDALWSCMKYSAESVDPTVSSERRRWSLVDAFVGSVNAHREAHVQPSDLLCTDESMCKWYGQGGSWNDRGLPMYVAIDCKPENGCEIQNTACGRSGIMLYVHLVNSAADQRERQSGAESSLLHGTTLLKRLVANCTGSGRIVCADSYFSSVEAALELKGVCLRFICVVKNSTTGYPMTAMSTKEIPARGCSSALYHRDGAGQIDLMAAMWVDRNRRYFTSTASTCLDGTPIERLRWRPDGEESRRLALTVPQPHVAQVYYQCCAQIDRHNRCRQDDLRLEHNYGTHDWSSRVNLSILGMCVVDSWMLYSGSRGHADRPIQAHFYEDLAAELIDNRYDSMGLRDRAAPIPEAGPADDPPSYGVGTHLTPTKKRRKLTGTSDCGFLVQRSCRVCKI